MLLPEQKVLERREKRRESSSLSCLDKASALLVQTLLAGTLALLAPMARCQQRAKDDVSHRQIESMQCAGVRHQPLLPHLKRAITQGSFLFYCFRQQIHERAL